MITLTSVSNAPNTTIRACFLALDAHVQDNRYVVINVQLFDAERKPIMLPRPVRSMNQLEQAAFLSLTANPGETPAKFLARAAAPYITSVYGVQYATA